MKQYIEATQIVKISPDPDGVIRFDDTVAPDWCRLEIEGDEDLDSGIAQVDKVMVDSKPYVMNRHYCRHDKRGSCDMTEIKVVR